MSLKRKNNYKNNSAIKAGIGYTIGNYLLRGLTFLTLPLFTRLLSTSDYGIYNTFCAYESILFVIIGFAIHSSYKNARYKYETIEDGAEKGCDYQTYISCTMVLLLISLITWLVIVNVFTVILQKKLEMNRLQQNILVLYAFSSAVITCYNSYVGINYQYKSFIKVAAINSVINIGLSVALILTIFNSKRYMGRIIGTAVPSFIISLIIMLSFLHLAKPRNIKSFLKWGICYSLPIIPHGLSQIILSSFDRIMILHMVNATTAGIYSFAYTICSIISVTASSLDSVWSPWFYEKKNEKREDLIRKYGSILAFIMFMYSTIIMLVAPELLKILGPKEYWNAIYSVIPLVAGAYFAFLYNLPACIEYYHEKTKYIAFGTMGAAVINIVLNYIFIKFYGYIAAAYTTLVTYLLYFIFHYFLAYRIEGKFIYNNKVIFVLSISMLIISFAVVCMIKLPILRWSIAFALGIMTIVVEEKKIGYVNRLIKTKLNNC